jgi:membrane protein insertase Oxa1/YidC/SpoIIIJ
LGSALLQSGLVKLGVPYSYGWSIVGLTALIKLVTFPLTKKQVGAGFKLQVQSAALACRHKKLCDQQ